MLRETLRSNEDKAGASLTRGAMGCSLAGACGAAEEEGEDEDAETASLAVAPEGESGVWSQGKAEDRFLDPLEPKREEALAEFDMKGRASAGTLTSRCLMQAAKSLARASSSLLSGWRTRTNALIWVRDRRRTTPSATAVVAGKSFLQRKRSWSACL